VRFLSFLLLHFLSFFFLHFSLLTFLLSLSFLSSKHHKNIEKAIYLIKYTNTNNLASNTAPTLASQRNVASSISVGGSQNYASSPVFASGTAFDGGDDRLIGLSYANGRLLASCTSYYGSTAAPPKLAVVYWFIDAASATQIYAGVFGDASWNAWSTSTGKRESAREKFIFFLVRELPFPFFSLSLLSRLPSLAPCLGLSSLCLPFPELKLSFSFGP